jgi:hypothetical protein
MFTFFHRKPTIVVDCFTVDPNAYKYAPIVQSKKTLPEWWKKLPSTNPDAYPLEHKNMKTCFGFNELYKRGCVIESWSDYKIIVNEKGYTYHYSSYYPPEEHDPIQWGSGFKNHFHMKLSSPWFLREKTGVYFNFIPALWNLDNYDFKILPGILNFKYQNQTNINIMLPVKKEEYIIDIRMGQSLVQLIPLRDDLNYEYKNHLISKQEYDNFFEKSGSANFRGIRDVISLIKRNEKRNSSKCPFHKKLS